MTGAGGCHLSMQYTESVPYFTEKAFIFAVAKHAEKFGMLLVWRHVSFCSVTINTCGLECVVALVSTETLICVLCEPSAPSSADKSGGILCWCKCVRVCACVCVVCGVHALNNIDMCA